MGDAGSSVTESPAKQMCGYARMTRPQVRAVVHGSTLTGLTALRSSQNARQVLTDHFASAPRRSIRAAGTLCRRSSAL